MNKKLKIIIAVGFPIIWYINIKIGLYFISVFILWIFIEMTEDYYN